MVVIVALFQFVAHQSERYADIEKISIVGEAIYEMQKIATYFLDHKEFPQSPEAVGVESVKRFENDDKEKSANFSFERRVDISTDKIVVSFGPDLEGDEWTTIIFRPKLVGEGEVRWSCNEGSLSNKYRTSDCMK